MTRPYNAHFHCANCHTWQSAETKFGRWIRSNPLLDSQSGYSIIDQDYWIHRYKINGNREFQLIMLVEIKTLGMPLSLAQRDTLQIANQLMRNRKATPTNELRHQAGYTPQIEVLSAWLGRKIKVRAYGMHILTFSGLGPDDSKWMTWSTKSGHEAIDADTLTKILRFDLDPDTLQPLDLRNHHRTPRTQNLPLPFPDDR